MAKTTTTTEAKPKPAGAEGAPAARPKGGRSKLANFLRELKAEWSRITFPDWHWPKREQWTKSSRGELWRMTFGVLIFTGVMTVIVTLLSLIVDGIFSLIGVGV